MPLTGVDRVRTLVGDLNKIAINEFVGIGTGADEVHKLDMSPVRSGTVTVFVSGVVKSGAVNFLLGTIDLTGITITSSSTEIKATYQFNALSDDEIQEAIDIASGGGTLIAGGIAARQIAGSQSRLFSFTQGSRTVNKDNIADKLIRLAESWEKSHKENIQQGGMTISIATFDDSGTNFESYDTAIANTIETGLC